MESSRWAFYPINDMTVGGPNMKTSEKPIWFRFTYTPKWVYVYPEEELFFISVRVSPRSFHDISGDFASHWSVENFWWDVHVILVVAILICRDRGEHALCSTSYRNDFWFPENVSW